MNQSFFVLAFVLLFSLIYSRLFKYRGVLFQWKLVIWSVTTYGQFYSNCLQRCGLVIWYLIACPTSFLFSSDNLQTERYLGDMHTNKKINNELKLLCKFLPKIIIITTTKSWVIYAGRNCWKKWHFFISCQLTVAQCYSPCNLFGKRCH